MGIIVENFFTGAKNELAVASSLVFQQAQTCSDKSAGGARWDLDGGAVWAPEWLWLWRTSTKKQTCEVLVYFRVDEAQITNQI